MLFAHEVILGHYALGAFVPTVVAAATAVVPYRLVFGDGSAFAMPETAIASLAEFPAFALLGVAAGAIAVGFQWALVGSDLMARRLPLPLWLRPVAGGVVLGAIGLVRPEVLGIGYEALGNVLHGQYALPLLLVLILAKMAATAVTLASRFGGGIVFPSLTVGALTGSAFGTAAAALVPALASPPSVYAILGMAAVAAAILGAPISTAVMVFELTGGFHLSIALLLSVAVANATTQALHGRSLIDWQLEMRGILLRDGAHRHTMRAIKVEAFMAALVAPAPLAHPNETVLHPATASPRPEAVRFHPRRRDPGGRPRPPGPRDRPRRPCGGAARLQRRARGGSRRAPRLTRHGISPPPPSPRRFRCYIVPIIAVTRISWSCPHPSPTRPAPAASPPAPWRPPRQPRAAISRV